MIMYNEQAVLERCLVLALKLVDEIIIVDTGSTDSSTEIASSFPVRLLTLPWRDDFSAPRNLSLDRASCDWILVLDPDEYIDPSDWPAFHDLTREWNNPSYIFTTRNYTNETGMIRFTPNDGRYPWTSHFKGFMPSFKTRLFQRRYNFRFRGCFHELLDYSIVESGLRSVPSTIPVHHWCSSAPNRSHADRQQLYLRLGLKKVFLEPDNHNAWNEYAVCLAIAGYDREALACWYRAVALGASDPHVYLSMHLASRRLGLRAHSQYYFEKSLCLQYPNLTHFHPLYKAKIFPE